MSLTGPARGLLGSTAGAGRKSAALYKESVSPYETLT